MAFSDESCASVKSCGLCRARRHLSLVERALCPGSSIPRELASNDPEEVRVAVLETTPQRAAEIAGLIPGSVPSEIPIQRVLAEHVAAAAVCRILAALARRPLEAAREDKACRAELGRFLEDRLAVYDLVGAIGVGESRAEFADRCRDFVALAASVVKDRKKKTSVFAGF